ncbi:MAG: hypothetical protein ACI80P_000607 [Flavobacteriales bacterium]|jgi:hypothetical protein
MNRTLMVTGSKQEFLLSDKNFTAELADYCHLSLLVDRDCVQWAVTSIDKDLVVEVGELISPSEKQLEAEKTLNYNYQSVSLVLRGTPTTIVPSGLFDASKIKQLLSLTYQDWQGDLKVADLPELNAKIVFAEGDVKSSNSALIKKLRANFPLMKTYACSELLIDAIMNRNRFERPHQVYVDLSKSFCDVYVAGEKKFKLYNHFEIQTDEDALYHITNSIQQLGLSLEYTTVYLSGDIEISGERYNLFQSYFPKISIHFGFELPNVSTELGLLRKHRFMALLNSYSCVS